MPEPRTELPLEQKSNCFLLFLTKHICVDLRLSVGLNLDLSEQKVKKAGVFSQNSFKI